MLFSLQSSFVSVFATPNIPVIQTVQLILHMIKLKPEDGKNNLLKGTKRSWPNCLRFASESESKAQTF